MSDDRDLEAAAIAACVRGRVDGLEHLYRVYRERVFRTCLRLLGERTAAEDATQDVFLRVYERLSSFAGQSAFSTWLYRLAVNHCLNLLDTQKRRSCLREDEAPEPSVAAALRERSDAAETSLSTSPEEACLQRQMHTRVIRLMADLSLEHRTVLVLREIEDLTYSEIATVLEIPTGTVMSRLARAREALKQLWMANASPVSSHGSADSGESEQARRGAGAQQGDSTESARFPHKGFPIGDRNGGSGRVGRSRETTRMSSAGTGARREIQDTHSFPYPEPEVQG